MLTLFLLLMAAPPAPVPVSEAARCQAIIKGDGELAAQRARDHVMIQGQRFADLMASLPQLTAVAG